MAALAAASIGASLSITRGYTHRGKPRLTCWNDVIKYSIVSAKYKYAEAAFGKALIWEPVQLSR